MYERFTDRARLIMQLANKEAQRLNRGYIDTEHILYGLVNEGSGVAANVLKNLDVSLEKIRFEVEKLLQIGSGTFEPGKLPQTRQAKKVIEYAMEEGRSLHHNYVGSEHILLGLIRVDDGIASQVLIKFGVSLESAKGEVANLVGDQPQSCGLGFEPTDEHLRRLMKQHLVAMQHLLNRFNLKEERKSQLPAMLKEIIDEMFGDGFNSKQSSKTDL